MRNRGLFLLIMLLVVSGVYANDSVPSVADRVSLENFRIVRTISHEEIARLPIRTVTDVLRYIPGLDMRERGASGVQADVAMRGGTADEVKVYLNGVEMNNPQTGHYTMNLPLDVNLIERVEVVKGTAYAMNAACGAINIVTKRMAPSNSPLGEDVAANQQDSILNYAVIGSLSAGEYGYIAPSLVGMLQKNDWQMSMAANYNRSSGYATNTDYQIANAYLQTSYKDIDFQLGTQMKNAGAQNFYTLHFPNQYDATHSAFLTAKYNHTWGPWSVNANAYYQTSYNHFELYRDGRDELGNPAPDDYVPSEHFTHSVGARALGGYTTSWGQTTVGLDLRQDWLISNLMGNHNRFNLNYFAEQDFAFGDFSAAFGLMGHYNSQYGNNISAGLDLGYEFYPGFDIFASLHHAVRVPTFVDAFYLSPTQQATTDLKPEKLTQIELGAQYAYKHFYINGALYYRWGRDVIDWVCNTKENEHLWYSTNHQRVNAIGAEFAFGWQGYEWLQRLEISYAYAHLYDFNTAGLLSQYAFDYMPHKVAVILEHKIWGGLGASWCLRYQNREGIVADHMNHGRQQYTDIFLLDGQIYYDYKFLRASIGCQNMTNQAYYDLGGVFQPKHWIYGTLLFRL